MKIIYTVLFLLFSLALSSQEIASVQHQRNNEIEGFKLYPNPVLDNVVYITTKNNARKNITIYDIFGEVLLQDRIFGKELSIRSLAPGIYVLQVTEENKTMTRKLVVK